MLLMQVDENPTPNGVDLHYWAIELVVSNADWPARALGCCPADLYAVQHERFLVV
jgi:hypothetical protein